MNETQEFGLEYIFSFLVLFGLSTSGLVAPPDRLQAPGARNVSHDMPPGAHVALHGLFLGGVMDFVE